MLDVPSFVAGYSRECQPSIAFAWNAKHAADFVDRNQQFRWEVIGHCIAHPECAVLFEQYLNVETLAGIREQLVRLESTTGARHKRDIEGLGTQLKDITRQIETLVTLLTEVEQRRPLLTKIKELDVKRVAPATKLQATFPSGADNLNRWDDDSLRSFVERYRSEMEFGDPESKKSIVRTLVASASLDGHDLTLVPNYPGITGVKMASPREPARTL